MSKPRSSQTHDGAPMRTRGIPKSGPGLVITAFMIRPGMKIKPPAITNAPKNNATMARW
jgi:hypothetical protein